MEAVGIREFRERLADYVSGKNPVAITRHGETLGFYIPAGRSRQAEIEGLRAAARTAEEMIASLGATEDELMAEVKQMRRTDRAKRRNAR